MLKYKNKFEQVKFYSNEEKNISIIVDNKQDFFKNIINWEYFYIIDDNTNNFYNHLFDIKNKNNYYDINNYSSVYELVEDANNKIEENIIITVRDLDELRIKYIVKNLNKDKILFLGFLEYFTLKNFFKIDYSYDQYENFYFHATNLIARIPVDLFMDNFIYDPFFNLHSILNNLDYQNIFLNTIEESSKNNEDINDFFCKDKLSIKYNVPIENITDNLLDGILGAIYQLKTSFVLRYIVQIQNMLTNTEQNILSILCYFLINQNYKEISIDEINNSSFNLNFEIIIRIMSAHNLNITKKNIIDLIQKTKNIFFKTDEDNYFCYNYFLLSYFAFKYLDKKEEAEKMKIIDKLFKNNILIEKYEGIIYFFIIINKVQLEEDYYKTFEQLFKKSEKTKLIKLNDFNTNAFKSLGLIKWYKENNVNLQNDSKFNYFYFERYFSTKDMQSILELYKQHNSNFSYEEKNVYYTFDKFITKEDINQFIKIYKNNHIIQKLHDIILNNSNYKPEKTHILNSSDEFFKLNYLNQSKNNIHDFNDCLEVIDIIEQYNCKNKYFIDINMNYNNNNNENKRIGKPKSENHISTSISKILKDEYGLRSVREEELDNKRRMDFTVSNNINANGYIIIEAKLYSNDIFQSKNIQKIKDNIQGQLLDYLIHNKKTNAIYLIYNFSELLLTDHEKKCRSIYEDNKKYIPEIISSINDKNSVNIVFKELYFK